MCRFMYVQASYSAGDGYDRVMEDAEAVCKGAGVDHITIQVLRAGSSFEEKHQNCAV